MLNSRRLPDHLRARLEKEFLDIFIEQHQMWEGYFAKQKEVRIAQIGQFEVLVPLTQDELENVEAIYLFKSPDGQTLTLYLADHNLDDAFPGILVVAERLEGTGIFVSKIYHASFHVSKLWHDRHREDCGMQIAKTGLASA